MCLSWMFAFFPLNPLRCSVTHTSTGKSSSAVRGHIDLDKFQVRISLFSTDANRMDRQFPFSDLHCELCDIKHHFCLHRSVNRTAPESGIPCKSSSASFNRLWDIRTFPFSTGQRLAWNPFCRRVKRKESNFEFSVQFFKESSLFLERGGCWRDPTVSLNPRHR